MKDLKNYIQEDLFATPSNTMGMGNATIPTEPNVQGSSGDMGLCCLDIKAGKMDKRRKKIRRFKKLKTIKY